MKKLILLATYLGIQTAAIAMPKDTTIIEFDDKSSKSKVKVISGDKKTFEIPKSLNLNNILKALGVDSSEREKAYVLISKKADKQDTILVVSQEGQKIKIITKDLKMPKSDTLIKENDEITTFEEQRNEDHDYDNSDHKNKKEQAPKKPKKFFSRSDFGIYLGLNNFTEYTSKAPDQLLSLRNFASRYVALSFRKNATLVRGNKVDWAISYGPEIAWYNFMFKNSNVAKYDNNAVSFVENTKPTEKSKLVMPYVNFPVMFNFGFKEDKFKIGFGGYVGYRVGGYTKEKYVNGGKNKTKGDYGFNDLMYGVTAEIGKRNGMTIFARYDLNKLFKESQSNFDNIQAFSLGLRL